MKTLKARFVNKYENYRMREGTQNIKKDPSDEANQENAQFTSVKAMIEKYGMLPSTNRQTADEMLYLDNTYEDMTLNERLKFRDNIDTYFEQLPPQVRKKFADNKQKFYECIMTKQYDLLMETGVMNQEMVDERIAQEQAKQQKVSELTNQINNLKSQITALEVTLIFIL